MWSATTNIYWPKVFAMKPLSRQSNFIDEGRYGQVQYASKLAQEVDGAEATSTPRERALWQSE